MFISDLENLCRFILFDPTGEAYIISGILKEEKVLRFECSSHYSLGFFILTTTLTLRRGVVDFSSCTNFSIWKSGDRKLFTQRPQG